MQEMSDLEKAIMDYTVALYSDQMGEEYTYKEIYVDTEKETA